MINGLKAINDAGFKRFIGVHDLNFNLHICDALGFEQPGVMHERGQDADGLSGLRDVSRGSIATIALLVRGGSKLSVLPIVVSTDEQAYY
jgi:hypothetical protein